MASSQAAAVSRVTKSTKLNGSRPAVSHSRPLATSSAFHGTPILRSLQNAGSRSLVEVLRDTIQPFPGFSEIYATALAARHYEVSTARQLVQPQNGLAAPRAGSTAAGGRGT